MTTRIFTLNAGRHDAPSGHTVTLALKELMPDDGGEVVVFNQAGTDITVLTDDTVTASGIETEHVTRAGQNVAGFAYCRFAGGITVFYPRTHHLMVTDDEETESV